MSLGNIDDYMRDESKITNLDWLDVKPGDYDNIPSCNPIEAIPQLSRAWNHYRDKSVSLIPNQVLPGSPNNTEVGPDKILDVVNTAKKAMMSGTTGKELSHKLASLYNMETLEGAKEELTKLASEQGLLGNVYIDLTPFDTCKDAARALGPHKVRLAKYAVGSPRRQAKYMDDDGYCLDLKKHVVAAVEYTPELLEEYSNHLRLSGVLSAGEGVSSKETLREALLKKNREIPVMEKEPKKEAKVDIKKVEASFREDVKKVKESEDKAANDLSLKDLRPVLAYIQDEMLRGKIGNDLKESISKKFSNDIVQKYAEEIKKVASLQGLLGNVYVDISYYDSAEAAVKAIKTATTRPAYLVYTAKTGPLDDTLERVVKATGCVPLPRDGRIDKKIAMSYIEDLRYSSKISSVLASDLISKLSAGDNTLEVVKESFMRSAGYVKPVRMGGVQGYEHKSYGISVPNNENLVMASKKALMKGIACKDVEARLSRSVKAPEAKGIVKTALQEMHVVDAKVLGECKTVRYAFRAEASLTPASKCAGCTYNVMGTCSKQRLSFTGTKDRGNETLDSSVLENKGIRTAGSVGGFFQDEMVVDVDDYKNLSAFEVSGLSGSEGMDAGMK